MKKSLLITFDFTQRGKSGTGLAAACLLSSCRNHTLYEKEFSIKHMPIILQDKNVNKLSAYSLFAEIQEKGNIESLDSLILACYIWSSHLVEPLIKLCRESGFTGKVILGGYQIHRATCKQLYPSGDIYILGYGEAALPEAILMDRPIRQKIMERSVDFDRTSSAYLDGSYPIDERQEMVHWETRRGCVFKCNFCAHRDLQTQGVHKMALMKVKAELDLFHRKNVKKINVLDPVFNREMEHAIEVLRYAKKIGLKSLLSLQVRFEMISIEFLEACKGLHVELEFGLQTAIEEEYLAIERPNNMERVSEVIERLKFYKVDYEVSLIYGLPTQTFDSFKKSVRYLQKKGVPIIKAFPLMLLEGTDLKNNKEKFKIKEKIIDDSGIPHVVESHTFTESEWWKMHSFAKSLDNKKEAA